MRVLKTTAAGLLVLLVVAAPPYLLIRYIGNPYPPEGLHLASPLTDNAIMGLIAVLVWILWAQFVLSLLVEGYAALTDRAVGVQMPVFGIQQDLARTLVAALITTTVVAPIAIGSADPAAAADSTPTATGATSSPSTPQWRGSSYQGGHHDPHSDTTADRADLERTVTARTPARPEQGTETIIVTVQRGDTLWSLAETNLGDGDRWAEIAAANSGQTMSDGVEFTSANQIRPGWRIAIPRVPVTSESAHADRPQQQTEPYRVEAGDTLSDIAEEELGDASRFPEIFAASRGITQPGGQRLSDPDVIDVGWTVTIPRKVRPGKVGPADPAGRGSDRAGARATDREAPGGRAHPATRRPVPPAARAAQGSVNGNGRSPASSTAKTDDGSGFTALRALLATASCLSVGALGLIVANRRRQFRRRRLGRTIASTPPELAEVEQMIVQHGSEAQQDVTFLDRALRQVAAHCRSGGQPLPHLGAAVLGTDDLTLLFTQSATAEVPDGWTSTDDARAWVLPRRTFMAESLETQPAPYPALVTIGEDEDGRAWLLDLEAIGVCGIGGEPQQVADVTRFLVAELAVNAWSEGSEVLLADEFGAETIDLNPARLRQVERSDALARAAVLSGEAAEVERNLGADVLTRRRDGHLLDTTSPVVVVVPSLPEGAAAADLNDRDRSRVVVVHADDECPTVELTSDGMAFLPLWGIRVRALTLPRAEAQAMASLLASTRVVEDEPVPAPDSDDGPLGRYARCDGALRDEYTEPRRATGSDASSLLPDADEVYVSTAATTPEDMAAVAPSVPKSTHEAIEAIDPGLDQDLADWVDESSPRPKVRLLGPVDVTARNGGDPDALSNLGGTISFVAFLACQERGVTGERVADAFRWKTLQTVQNRATDARFLLGTRPDGGDWLPDASTSDGARRGTPTYGLVKGADGVLVDADLFVRLKFRAQKRGDEGCEEDLVTALSLIAGAPFEAATERRFPWLLRGQRHDVIMVGAIEDAAHVLATRAIATGRTDLVRRAGEAARKACPDSDVAWLDLAAATEAESGRGAADELVREKVVDRVDEDLPPRTEAVADQRHWATG